MLRLNAGSEGGNVPLFMDRHYIKGATQHAIQNAHTADLAVQDKYLVKFITYWFDETRSTAFCLVDSPDRESITHAHAEAHGEIPNEIIEVNPAVVEAFLGRIKDPAPPCEGSAERKNDSAFRTILCTDLQESTAMAVRLGDTRALHLLHVHNAITRNALKAHEGREARHTGDGIIASFTSAKRGVECAIAIQKMFRAHNDQNPDDAMHVRIGLNAGEPIEEDNTLFGTTVILAVRICAFAQPNGIVVSQLVRDECGESDFSFSEGLEAHLKGFDHPIGLAEVIWT